MTEPCMVEWLVEDSVWTMSGYNNFSFCCNWHIRWSQINLTWGRIWWWGLDHWHNATAGQVGVLVISVNSFPFTFTVMALVGTFPVAVVITLIISFLFVRFLLLIFILGRLTLTLHSGQLVHVLWDFLLILPFPLSTHSIIKSNELIVLNFCVLVHVSRS